MKKLNLIGVLVLLACAGVAQNIASRVIDYQPAPGQHINIENIGTPQAAQNMVQNESALVSLGGFGGYIVLGFDEPCENDPGNPYGIDFTIFGNAFGGSSEAGVVWVMKDANKNGLPDDTWCQIAGSHHFYSKTENDYGITYFKTETHDVGWVDSHGIAGTLKANSFNTQEYYPLESYFPDYPPDSVRFSGTKIETVVDDSNMMELKIKSLDFGYADNHSKKQGVDLTMPDNPYTEDVEGAGGDPIDISWAVDNSGNYVDLDEIHFVKIATGYLADLGRLGEASTDVSYVADVNPNASVSGKNKLLVVYHPPSKILIGDTIQLEANYFLNGKIAETEISFNTSNPEILAVDKNGKLIAQKTGEAEIRVSASEESKTWSIKVVRPGLIELLSDLSSVYPGDTVLLEPRVLDNTGASLKLSAVFSTQNSSIGKIISIENKSYFVAGNPGETAIVCSLENYDLEKIFPFKVHSESDKINIYFTLKTENENLLPLQWIEAGLTDLNNFVEERQKDYSGITRPVFAHAILSGLQKAQLNFVFKDNEDSGGELFLYSAEKDGLFTYGWGGKTDPQPFAKAWIARLNGKQYLNGFDKYQVTNGDTVVLYHVSDITNPWQFSRLLASEDSIETGETVEVQFEQTTCIFQDDTITESGFFPVENEEIVADRIYFTDVNGAAEVALETDPPWIISSGNNAVLVSEKITTTASRKILSDLQVFPNPAGQFIKVSGQNLPGSKITVFNLNGQLLLEKVLGSNPETLNLKALPKGMYQLSIEQNNSVHNFKIVKK